MGTQQRDPIESMIEGALRPGTSIRESESFEFVRNLESLAERIGLIVEWDPVRAIGLLEAFLATAYLKIEEIDGEGWSFAQFFQELVCRWIVARQAAATDSEETVGTLLKWVDKDQYGFFSQIEKAVVEALDAGGRRALERQVRSRFYALEPGDFHERQQCAVFLKAICLTEKDHEGYAAVASEFGLGVEDCLELAKAYLETDILCAHRWLELGRDLAKEEGRNLALPFDFGQVERAVLLKMGRRDEVVSILWQKYESCPSHSRFQELLDAVPSETRSQWRERALEKATASDFTTAAAILAEENAWPAVAELVRIASDRTLEGTSHYLMEPVAKGLEEGHPDLAARLWRAQALRIVDAGKSKYYEAALENLSMARQCYLRAGLAHEWEATVAAIRTNHSRKRWFLAKFELVAAGMHKEAETFVERAKREWLSS